MNDTVIAVLVDNKAADGLVAEHGLSLWIEHDGHRILFDTGQGDALLPNSLKLGVAIETADDLVLSHGHYDHTGGLAAVLNGNPDIRVYLHPAAVQPRYSIRDGIPRPIHTPQEAIKSLNGIAHHRIHWVTEETALAGSAFLTGSIPRRASCEDAGGPFFLDQERSRPDPVEDDLALWISTPKGLVVCVGCAHAGIINTLTHIRQASGTSKIKAVIGGLHLANASDERVIETAAAFRHFQPDLLVPCHCTGDTAVLALKEVLGDRVRPGYAGMTLNLE